MSGKAEEKEKTSSLEDLKAKLEELKSDIDGLIAIMLIDFEHVEEAVQKLEAEEE